jgi:hypothetical protein
MHVDAVGDARVGVSEVVSRASSAFGSISETTDFAAAYRADLRAVETIGAAGARRPGLR